MVRPCDRTVEVGDAIAWPNQADLDPDVVYSIITGQAIPNYQ